MRKNMTNSSKPLQSRSRSTQTLKSIFTVSGSCTFSRQSSAGKASEHTPLKNQGVLLAMCGQHYTGVQDS